MKQLITIFILCLGVKGFSQQPIFTSNGSNLYSVNLNNCTSRIIIGPETGIEFGDIAFTPDGRLWGIGDGNIYLIDTINASTTLIGHTYAAGVSLVALNDSILLTEYKDSLWGINDSDLHTYNIGNIGYSAAGDLTWYDNDLYMSSGLLIKIVLNSTYNAIISSSPVSTTPLPPDCEGMVTASFAGLENSIVVFSGNDNAYKICPIDGSSQLLCASTTGYYAVPGAASIRLPTQNPLPTSCLDIFPINLLNFSFSITNNTIQLHWQTTTEINGSNFLIERSADGTNFTTIGKVEAVGNSNSLEQYTFTDYHPNKVNYYRLKEIDRDSTFTYSNILLAKIIQLQPLVIIQNPVQNNLKLQINMPQSEVNNITIYDFSGKRLNAFSVQNGVQNINVSFLPTGIYLVQMITADGQVVQKEFEKEN